MFTRGYLPFTSQKKDQLHDVQQLSASSNAFCALRGDGRCITWGDPGFGGDSSGPVERVVREVELGVGPTKMWRKMGQ